MADEKSAIVLPQLVIESSDYDSIEVVSVKPRRLLARARRVSDGCQCFLKIVLGDVEGKIVRDEFNVLQTIGEREGLIQVFEIIKTSLGHGLVSKYIKGVPISQSEIFPSSVGLTRESLQNFCRAAIRACEALGWVHRADIVHRDISESNVIFNKKTHAVTIIDFGFSARSTQLPVMNVVGTWKYISPEQTGRTSLGVDCRADLYSLGAVLYEVAAGRSLFLANDAPGMIHQHLTGEAIPVQELRFGLPHMLSRVVMKLVEKHPSHRYQSAWGAMSDFKQCLAHFETNSVIEIPVFELATKDIANTIRRPTTLYGRDGVIKSLGTLLDAAKQGSTQMVLLSGPSGSGKSSLAKELHRAVREQNVMWLGSKLDQYTRVPYACFLPIFEQFVDRMLTLDPDDFAKLQEELIHALGGYGQLLLNSFPMLHLLIGDQKPAPELSPCEERNKFLRACADLFAVSFGRAEQAVVLFFDDMQWADTASFTLLQTVCSLRKLCMTVVCANRVEEVDALHPLTLCVEQIQLGEVPVSRFNVENLTHPQICNLLTATFQGHCKDTMVNELATSILDSTSGNPFYVTQLLDALYAHKAIQFERVGEAGEWVWYPHVVITDNVIDLLISKINSVSKQAQQLLRMAAIIGSEFDVPMMHQLTEIPMDQLLIDLFGLVSVGLIVIEESELTNKPRSVMIHTAEVLLTKTYRFLHDRVQQAASSLFENEETKEKAHYFIGMKLWKDKIHLKDKLLFDVANHMLAGVKYVKKEELLEVCELFLEAGKNARGGMSSVYAQKYLSAILGLIPPTDKNWHTYYQLLRSCYIELSEVAFQLGQFKEAQHLLSAHLLERAVSNIDKAEVLDKMVAIVHATGDMHQAGKLCFEILAMFGVHFPQEGKEQALEKEYQAFQDHLAEKKIDDLKDLLELPVVTGAEDICICRAFKSILAPLFTTDPPMLRLVAATAVNFSLKHGISNFMCYPYGMFAMVLHWFFNDPIGAQSLAMAALGINERFGGVADHYRSCLIVGACVFIWTRSIADADALLEKGTQLAILHGDFLFCSFLYFCRSFQIYSRPTLTADLNYLQELHDGNQTHGAGILQGRLIIEAMMLGNLCLQGKTRHPFSFEIDSVVPDLDVFLNNLTTENYVLGLLAFYIYRAFVLLILWDIKGAFDSLEKVRPLVPYMPGLALNAPFRFIEALARLQRIAPSCVGTCQNRPVQPGPCTEEEARTYLVVVDQNLCTLQGWAKTMPRTYMHMLLIVYAEKRRVLRACPHLNKIDPKIFDDPLLQEKDRYELYRSAITSAAESGITGHVGLCHELTMRYWQTLGENDYARIHWRAAMMAYYSWGAKNKTTQLQEEFNYSNITRSFEPQNSPNTAATANHESFSSLVLYEKQTIFAASRLISSEIVLDRLLVKLMAVIAEHVGATFGLLLSYEAGSWTVECSYGASTTRMGLPSTLLNFVYKKHEVVALSDAATHETYHRDPYIAHYKPKSVLCVPIVLHGTFINAIYLENNGFEGSFTSSLSEVAEILASQAATAIQNGRLYRKLDEYTQSLEQQVRDRTVELLTAREHADQANKAKSTFLASMSHEIRTPMNGIMASMELMKMTTLTTEQTELADVVITCSDALLVLINDILDLSKIEADKLELESVWFDLQRCLESVLDILAPKAFPKGLDIEFQTWGSSEEKIEVSVKGVKNTYFPNVPRIVKGDYTRIRQIVINLCNNAVKFTHSGEVTVRVWWRSAAHENNFVGQSVELYFSVQDTGIGIPSHRLPVLFKAFSQVENSTTRKYGGTGLGLAICQPLVQLMGGHIWVESVENKGSNFQFTITTTADESREAQCVNIAPEGGVRKIDDGNRKLKVLLVQDKSKCAEIFKASLEQLGCDATRVPLSGGMAALQSQHFDVCLVDWAPVSEQEPSVIYGEEELHLVTRVKHGEQFIQAFRKWELAQRLREDEEVVSIHTSSSTSAAPAITTLKRLPIVLISYDRQHKIDSLIDGFLSKPTKQRQVVKVLDACCSQLSQGVSTPIPKPGSLLPRSGSAQPGKAAKLKLMMAEDNKINVRMATKMVESLGYNMCVVGNGKLAVDLVKTWYDEGTPCQVILMDVQMPVMDGLEATTHIRAFDIPIAEQPYIIALTANAMASDKLVCLQAGMNDYLSKPLNRQDLARALRNAARAKGIIVSNLEEQPAT